MRTISEIRDDLEENSYARNKLETEVTIIEGRIESEPDKARGGLQEALGNLKRGIDKHHLTEKQLRIEYADVLSAGVRSGRFATEDGTNLDQTWRSSESHEGARRRTDLDGALHTLERFKNSGHLSTRAADGLDAMVRERDAGGIGARYLAAVGNPHYASAFEKILRDPQVAHYRFTREEADAVQRVGRVESERALVEGTGSAGGFAVPFQLDPSILHSSSSVINPLRDIASVIQVSTNQWRGVAADAPTAAYQPEANEVVDSSPTLVQPIINIATWRAFAAASFELFIDWDGIVQELSALLQQARDILDGTKMLLGSGVAEPVGLLSIGTTGSLSTTQRVLTAGAGAYALADVYALKQALAATVFGPNATWLAHPTTFDKTFRFVGGGSTTEPPLFADFDRTGPILGRPLREISTMVTTVTTGSRIAVYGDFSGFRIADRIGTQIELIGNLFGAANRLPTGQRGLLLWGRTGTGVIVPNKFRYLEAS